MIGLKIAHYEIIGKLGEGGMGVVYRARDTTLNREVAIKVLPEILAGDSARMERFHREAQLLAQLNHPNISSIYGVEQADGANALVMELVEGPTLAERLNGGAIPLDEALPIARQIAEALEAAHERGIIHRDLKPANVKVRPDGTVKVLDFGLAKALEGNAASADPVNSPTLTVAATLAGVIMGTAAYMSPEQARGQDVDKRSDIWSFGVVLYEMLTGRQLFGGETVSDSLAGVLKTEIDFALLRADTPSPIRRLLRRSLERNPQNRLHDIADARLVIQDVIADVDDPDLVSVSSSAPSRPFGGSLLWLAAVVLAIAGAGLFGYFASPGDGTPAAPMRLAVQLAASQELVVGGDSLLAFSPDGKSLVFTARENGRQTLFRRDLGEPEATPIPGTENGDAAFFSPDGRWIGFVAGGKLWKIAAEGGRPFQLGDSRGAGGATWLSDGAVVFAPMYSEGLFHVSAEGGPPERLTTPDRANGELGHWWPQTLPGVRKIVFTAYRAPLDRSRIGLLDLDTKEIRWIVDGGFFGRYVSTGHLLYAKGQRLYAVPFDPGTARATGSAAPVLDNLRVSETGGFAMIDVSSRGTLAYVTESLGNPPRELVWLDRSGNSTPATNERHRYLTASLSPDGRQAALTIRGENRDLWTYSFDRGTMSRLTSGEDTEFDPKWSRDGRELFYVVDSPPFELHRIRVGAPDSGEPIWDEAAELDTTNIAVSPDGRTIAYSLTEAQTGENLYVRPIDGSEPPSQIRVTHAEERYSSFSPDGRFVVYQSDETGRPEIYVEAVPPRGNRVQVSANGGSEPLWARNGEIFYRQADEIHVVPTRLREAFEFDAPRRLFFYPIVAGGKDQCRTFDVTADGTRILAITIPEVSRPRQIEIITDWADELERLAPKGSP
jgi:eukaryotic-like serine/threonine-protein kinase